MGTVIMMRAFPGSGKTTYAKKLFNKLTKDGASVHIFSADQHFYDLGHGVYKFDATQLPIAHKKCFEAFEAALKEGIDYAIVDNTNLIAKFVEPYKRAADKYHYKFLIKNVIADPVAAFERNVHGVPREGHGRMQQSFYTERLPEDWAMENVISRTVEGEPFFEEQEDATIKHASLLRLATIFKKTAESSLENDFEFFGTFHLGLPRKSNNMGTITQVTSEGSVRYSVADYRISEKELLNGNDKKCAFIKGYIGKEQVAILTRFLE